MSSPFLGVQLDFGRPNLSRKRDPGIRARPPSRETSIPIRECTKGRICGPTTFRRFPMKCMAQSGQKPRLISSLSADLVQRCGTSMPRSQHCLGDWPTENNQRLLSPCLVFRLAFHSTCHVSLWGFAKVPLIPSSQTILCQIVGESPFPTPTLVKWVWVKKMYLRWNPAKWKQGLL